MEVLSLDQLVQLPGTYESPKYLTDVIAVAAEECSGSYSQGSSSPDTYLSVADDTNIDLLDLPNIDDDAVNEIVNGLVCEDPSFGSVLIDDISCIFNNDAGACDLPAEESHVAEPSYLAFETPTRRKQRIVPMASKPFEYTCEGSPQNNNVQRLKLNNRKRSREFPNDFKCIEIKSRVISPANTYIPRENNLCLKSEELPADQFFKAVKNENNIDSTEVKQSLGVRMRKRGLTHDERKERKKQSNRNASYRYRQRKKEEMDTFLQNSAEIMDALDKEKEAYYNVVEEFVRCIKRARLVNEARG